MLSIAILTILDLSSLVLASAISKRAGPVYPRPAGWTYSGCFNDTTSNRVLSRSSFQDSSMYQAECLYYCNASGYTLAGLEYSSECYCGYQLDSSSTQQPDTDCNMHCSGNYTETCGGPNRLSVFKSSVPAPIVNPGPPGWSYLNCYTDNVYSRTLSNRQNVPGGASNMTVAGCTSACQALGYQYAGVEFAQECYCDDNISPQSYTPLSTGCNKLCTGNSSEYCGGSSALNVYQLASTPNSGSLPTGWNSMGCFTDSVSKRTLRYGVGVPGGGGNMSIENCLSVCQSNGYSLAGVEYSQECYCDYQLQNGGSCAAAQNSCNMHCAGSLGEMCGGGNRLNVYQYGSGPVVSCAATTSTAKATTISTSTSSTSAAASSAATTSPAVSSGSPASSSSSSSIPAASSGSSTTNSSSASASSTSSGSTMAASPSSSTQSTSSTTPSASPTNTSAALGTTSAATTTTSSTSTSTSYDCSKSTSSSGFITDGDFEDPSLPGWKWNTNTGSASITTDTDKHALSGCSQLSINPYTPNGGTTQVEVKQTVYNLTPYAGYYFTMYQGWDFGGIDIYTPPKIQVTLDNGGGYPQQLFQGSACQGDQCNVMSPMGYGYQQIRAPFQALGYSVTVHIVVTWSGGFRAGNGLLIDKVSLVSQNSGS